MGQRTALQSLLETVLGSENVYFQPPASVQMQYPCIVYKRDNVDTEFADNAPYTAAIRYSITYIDRNPDSAVFLKLVFLPMCLFNRNFVAQGLNHDVFLLFF